MGDTRPLVVSAFAVLEASADRVYQILADYRNGHPHILPAEFRGITVEQGGVGEGTTVRFQMRVMGRTQTFRAAITEPEPGRTLVETGLDSNGAVTTFTVDPAEGGSRVTISTSLATRGGLRGVIEGWVTRRVLLSIYRRELQKLAGFASRE